MRIISGEYRRRKLAGPPEGAQTRPYPDLVKEAVFNLLRGHFEGARVCDVFCGAGTMGLEAVSRGAEHVVLIERDKRVVSVLRRNIETLGCAERVEVVQGDALGPGALARCPDPCDVLFVDPPYAMVRDPRLWPRVRAQFERFVDRLAPTGFGVLRTPWPFLHLVEPEDAAGSIEHEEPAEVVEIDLEDVDALARLDAFEADLEAAAKPGFVGVDLGFDRAEGPETHAYGSTAIHLYMKRSGGAVGSDA